METLDAILTRRSIRKYTDKPVTDEQVKMLLTAAMAAPSAGNAQPWQFVVVRDHDLLAKVAAAASVHRHGGQGAGGHPGLRRPAGRKVPGLLGHRLRGGGGRTCSWRPTAWAWARCGRASTPCASARRPLPGSSARPRASSPTPSSPWGTRRRPSCARTATGPSACIWSVSRAAA